MNKDNEDWSFKPKKYSHFDNLVYNKNTVLEKVTNPEYVKGHPFLPFIEYDISNRRLSIVKQRQELIAKNKLEEAEQLKKKEKKTRPIKRAYHMDAQIFSYYRFLLMKKYESKLIESKLTSNITAYRKIPVDGNNDKGKCNIHFAKEVFDKIAEIGNCVVLTFDTSGFFEALDHEFLKKKWCELLNKERLPDDHYHVFKNITNYKVVRETEVYDKLGYYDHDKHGKKYYRKKFIFKKKKKLCSMEEYRKKIVAGGLIKDNPYSKKSSVEKGIPQGSPISDVLANLYMIDFDKRMKELEIEYNGFYRRYSDDIIWVCNSKVDADTIEEVTKKLIEKQGRGTLEIQDKKKTTTVFKNQNGNIDYEGDKLNYLGFRFDGQKAFLKDVTNSRYFRKINAAIRSFVKSAKDESLKNGRSLKDNLNLGLLHSKIHHLQKSSEENYIKKREGNFFTYYNKAVNVFNIDDKNSKYKLSETQLSRIKIYINKAVEKECKKYDTNFVF